jgi:hypothetical protein
MSNEANALKLFRVQEGAVTGTCGQDDANHFAADFQGLRHFGAKIGEALDLGEPWLGAFRETDFTHLWAAPQKGDSAASGAMTDSRAQLRDLLEAAVKHPG